MKKICLSFFCAALFSMSASAQVITAKKNIFKVNLTSLIFKNGSFQYERIIGPKTSVALGMSIMPKTGLPFASTLQEQYGSNPDAKRAIETTQLSSFTVTPEVRFYLGSAGAPTGFYLAPFVRYQRMGFEQLYEFTASNNKKYSPLIGGNINNIGAGLLLGSQWALGKSVTLDWWIAGPLVGTSSGDLTGTANMSDMSNADRAQLESDIEEVPIPLTKIQATVYDNRVDVNLSGGYAGIRAFGIALGIRF